MEREPYAGPVIDLSVKPQEPDNPIAPAPTTPTPIAAAGASPQISAGFHSRGRTKGGYRNMQDSTFSLSGMTHFNPFIAMLAMPSLGK